MLKEYTRRNQSYKMAAPKKSDGIVNSKPKVSQTAGPLHAPILGDDYLYGFAHISAGRRDKESAYSDYKFNPKGWVLPGGIWTCDPIRAQKAAIEIDRLIRLAGGLPKSWMQGES